MKLYFNSFNNKSFLDAKSVENTVKKDIEAKIIGSTVTVNIMPLNTLRDEKLHLHLNGQCLDNLDIDCDTYSTDSSLLTTEDVVVEEIVYSHLLKSNCLVTNQPDWGSVEIAYKGKKINHAGLLRYIISFRNHNEFHEQCIERIFMDIMRQCQPQELTVYGRYTRRGGLDINPYRSTQKIIPTNLNNRLSRQ